MWGTNSAARIVFEYTPDLWRNLKMAANSYNPVKYCHGEFKWFNDKIMNPINKSLKRGLEINANEHIVRI